MNSKRIVLVAGLLVAVGALGAATLRGGRPSTLEIPVDVTVVPSARSYVEDAVAAFRRSCPGLNRNARIVEWAVADTTEIYPYMVDHFGWTRVAEVRLHLSGAAPTIKGVGVAAGHTCYYLVGSGARPGLVVAKGVCAAVCEQPGLAPDQLFPMAGR